MSPLHVRPRREPGAASCAPRAGPLLPEARSLAGCSQACSGVTRLLAHLRCWDAGQEVALTPLRQGCVPWARPDAWLMHEQVPGCTPLPMLPALVPGPRGHGRRHFPVSLV